MQIQKEVELYLQTCGEPHMGADTFRVIQPGDLCWLLIHRHWGTLEYFFQTVTLNGNSLILELWVDGSDIGEKPNIQECLSINTDLKTLQMALSDMAECGCREHIESLVVANYWKTDFDKTIERLSQVKKTKAMATIESFASKMSKLKTCVDRKDDINSLIVLCNQLDEDCEEVNQLYYA